MKTKRRGFFAIIGGGIAACFGVKPAVAKPLFNFKVRIIEAPETPQGKLMIMRAIIVKRDGKILKGKVLQGYPTKDFYDGVKRCENDGVGGEFLYSKVYRYHPGKKSYCFTTPDGEYVDLTTYEK